MTKYKLSYFDFNGGRGEPIRIMFHAAGIAFEDNRLSFEQFGQMRQGTRFNSLPVLHVDGVEVTQSNAMLRYLGKLGGLYPTDNLQALYCDEVMGAVENLSYHIGQTMRLQGDELREARQKLLDGWLTTYIRGMGGLLARGGGKYFCDNRLTVADLKAFIQTRWLQSGALDYIPRDALKKLAPALAEHQQRVEADPIVVAYYASRA
ncbi:MAG: glutathione S-transferase family protein [Gammaproteobacteria bacterium]|nr:glutathione S-transferase family protein [Gammaproteobacteria bacterium]MDH5304971.1 glutathione S-transferase family protein [Gammaproteobacteria bacterium]MDH5322003.1 glutathione S-transferase family protein [Gammaproteobacteria bacterium]